MYGMMVIYVETLTGTAFELHVSSLETIFQIKAKIQRIEGVPVSQQHLIWQSMELEDDYRLHDYGIHSGATLKLVLAMRGGPINTRRIPMEDPTLREITDYMEANGATEIWEKLPHTGNRQVTLLVFRDGDQLNFFRVVDRGDGTLTPVSDSMSAASMYNLYDEEEEEDSSTKDRVEENDLMKEKMVSLRSKMENMKLSSKPKKKPRPPSCGKPSSSRARLRRLASAGKNRHSAESASTLLNKNSLLPQIPTDSIDDSSDSGGKIAQTDASTLPLSASRNRRLDSSAKHTGCLPSVKEDTDLLQPQNLKGLGQPRTELTDGERPMSVSHAKELINDGGARPYTSSRKDRITLDTLKESLTVSLKPPVKSKSKYRERKKEVSFDVARPATSSRKEVLDSLRESLGRPMTSSKYALESLSSSEARAMSGLLRQASLERLGSSRIEHFVSSPPKGRITHYQESGRIPTPEGRLVSARLHKLSASRDNRLLSPTHRLPPVKAKKKASKRCYVCAKKTGLATSYQCRCGNNFCATHRYAESHDCTFDYKTEGRKLLEQSNPVVSAPKLPKI